MSTVSWRRQPMRNVIPTRVTTRQRTPSPHSSLECSHLLSHILRRHLDQLQPPYVFSSAFISLTSLDIWQLQRCSRRLFSAIITTTVRISYGFNLIQPTNRGVFTPPVLTWATLGHRGSWLSALEDLSILFAENDHYSAHKTGTSASTPHRLSWAYYGRTCRVKGLRGRRLVSPSPTPNGSNNTTFIQYSRRWEDPRATA